MHNALLHVIFNCNKLLIADIHWLSLLKRDGNAGAQAFQQSCSEYTSDCCLWVGCRRPVEQSTIHPLLSEYVFIATATRLKSLLLGLGECDVK